VKPEDLTVNFEENGELKVKELDKVILSSSASWATIAFLFQERDPEGGWRAPKVSVRRYRKRGKGYIVDKHVVLTGATQAKALADALSRWFAGEAQQVDEDDND
jgi:hypothetical protein